MNALRHKARRNPYGQWRRFDVADIFAQDKTSFAIFWIKDKSLVNLDSLLLPDVLVYDIIENFQSAFESFAELKMQLKQDTSSGKIVYEIAL